MKPTIIANLLAVLLYAMPVAAQEILQDRDPAPRPRSVHADPATPSGKAASDFLTGEHDHFSEMNPELLSPLERKRLAGLRELHRPKGIFPERTTGFSHAFSSPIFSSALDSAWLRQYGARLATSYDGATAIAVDNSGNVYVTGYSSRLPFGLDYLTIKYNAAGVKQWEARYNSPANGDNLAFAITVDGAGNVYVAGRSHGAGTGYDFATVKYNSAGAEQWAARYDGPENLNDGATGLVVDPNGNVYVAGWSWSANSMYDLITIKYNSAGTQQWLKSYNGAGNDWDVALDLALDPGGNICVTGYSYNPGTSYDFITLEYNSAGAQQWVKSYNGPANRTDVANELAIDPAGNVYVTGYSFDTATSYDYATVKYNNAGVEQWAKRYNGPGSARDEATGIAADAAGNVYVTGFSYGANTFYDYATIKYNAAGDTLWVKRYNAPGNYSEAATDLAVDGAGNVFVAGTSGAIKYNSSGTQQWRASDYTLALALDATGNVLATSYGYVTIKYNGAGTRLWRNAYTGPGSSVDQANALVVDAAGNIYVTGSSRSSSGYDYATIKYNNAGAVPWVARYNSPANSSDIPAAIAVDAAGNVYVTGRSYRSGTTYDYATVKYNSAGVQQWVAYYDGGVSDWDGATALAVDREGNVYVTGWSAGPSTLEDYATVKYNSAGIQQWAMREGEDSTDVALALAVDATGNVYVTGYIFDAAADFDYATVKYNSAGARQWLKRYNGPGNSEDYATALGIDAAGNVYVTGLSDGAGTYSDFATIKYDPAGNQLWLDRYHGPGNGWDGAYALALDATGNIHVAGTSRGAGTGYDYAIIKYNPAGQRQWVARYAGISTDNAYALAIDAASNVYVTGYSDDPNTSYDYATVKYNSAGVEQGVGFFRGYGRDIATAIGVDAAGNAYVTGTSTGTGWSLYTTIKYVTATPPPSREVRVAASNASAGDTVEVPIELIAQGDENALGFSLNFDPAILSNPKIRRGNDAGSAIFIPVTSQVSSGRLGITLALPAGQSFTAGTHEIVKVTFTVNANTTADSTRIEFGDQPIAREVVDVNANILAATWTGGKVMIARGFEADVAPRPNGNGSVTIADWVQVGRFSAGLDTARVDVNEFQRADCAPKTSCGDGRITISDWVQAGRYAAGLDTVIAVCGPTSSIAALASGQSAPEANLKAAASRTVRAVNTTFKRGQVDTLKVELEAQGDENALGFSVSFDPSVLTFKEVVRGSGASSPNPIVNGSQTANGRLGIALALPAGQTFFAGTHQIALVAFSVNPSTTADSTRIEFGDQPVAREVVDVNANSLTATWTAGTVKIEAPTSVKEIAGETPSSFELGSNYPNPFNPETTIEYAIPAQAAGMVRVTLRIYNLQGQLLRTLVDEEKSPGHHRVVWDGKNDLGAKVSSGVYLYTINAGYFKATRKMTITK